LKEPSGADLDESRAARDKSLASVVTLAVTRPGSLEKPRMVSSGDRKSPGAGKLDVLEVQDVTEVAPDVSNTEVTGEEDDGLAPKSADTGIGTVVVMSPLLGVSKATESAVESGIALGDEYIKA